MLICFYYFSIIFLGTTGPRGHTGATGAIGPQGYTGATGKFDHSLMS